MNIKILSVRLKNFRSFPNKVTEVNLEENPKIILKGKNGAGKTSLVYGILYALYDNDIFNKIKVNELVNRYNSKEMFVEVDIVIDGTAYTIKRGRRSKQPFLEIAKDGVWLPIENFKDADAYLKELIPVDSSLFSKLFFVNSSIFTDNFLKLSKTEREKLLNRILGIDEYKEFILYLKRMKTEYKKNIAAYQDKFEEIEKNRKYFSEILEKKEETLKKIKENKKEITAVKNLIKKDEERFLKESAKFDETFLNRYLFGCQRLFLNISPDKNEKENLALIHSLSAESKKELKLTEQKLNTKLTEITKIQKEYGEYTELKDKYLNLRNIMMEYYDALKNDITQKVEDKNKEIYKIEKKLFEAEKELNELKRQKDKTVFSAEKETDKLKNSIKTVKNEIKNIKKSFYNEMNVPKIPGVSSLKNELLGNFLKSEIIEEYKGSFEENTQNSEDTVFGVTFKKYEEYKNRLKKIKKDKVAKYKKELKDKKEELKKLNKTFKNVFSEYEKKHKKLNAAIKKKEEECALLKKQKENFKEFKRPEKEFNSFFNIEKYTDYKTMKRAVEEFYKVENLNIDGQMFKTLSEIKELKNKIAAFEQKGIKDVNGKINALNKEINLLTKEKDKLSEKIEDLKNLEKDLKNFLKQYKSKIKAEELKKQIEHNKTLLAKLQGVTASENVLKEEIKTFRKKTDEFNKEYNRLKEEKLIKQKEAIMLDSIFEKVNSPETKDKIYNSYKKLLNGYFEYYKEQLNTYDIKLEKDFNISIYHRKRKIDYANLSKGEETKLNLVVIFSLIRLIETISRTKIDTLIFDEIDGVLDKDNLNQVIQEINKEDKKIIFITHRNDIESEYTDFNTINVEKDGFFTKLKYTEV